MYESKYLSSMHTTILFDKMQEHEIKLNLLIENEEGNKIKKTLEVKVVDVKDKKSEEENY